MTGRRTGFIPRTILAIAAILAGLPPVSAQEMQPRAYLPSPVGVGFAGISYSYNAGGLLFDPSLPITDGHVSASLPTLSVGGTFATFGRTSQFLTVMPYAIANLSGTLDGESQFRYRSGLTDMTFRYSVNLLGAPAMHRRDFAKYRQKTIVGVSLTATAPTGQYDPKLLINIGTNRWAFKPEVGISRALGKWALEGAFGVWLYTTNTQFYGNSTRTQNPLWSWQAHVVRLLGRHWFAYDFTYFRGGDTLVNGQTSNSYQANTRMGLTYGLRVTPRQAIRFSYFKGVTTRIGSDISSVGVAYQVIWATGR